VAAAVHSGSRSSSGGGDGEERDSADHDGRGPPQLMSRARLWPGRAGVAGRPAGVHERCLPDREKTMRISG
jgi:hypothetical protein